MATIHMYDSGIYFLITIQDESGPVNLTTVSLINLYFQRPDKSVITRSCDIVNTSTGLIRYISSNSDFNQAGRWYIQVVVQFPDGTVRHSDIGSLTVEKNLI